METGEIGRAALAVLDAEASSTEEALRALLALRVTRAMLGGTALGGGARDATVPAVLEHLRRLRGLVRDTDPVAPGLFGGPLPSAPVLERAAALLDREPVADPASLGEGLEQLRGTSASRKRSGSYYTARRLARTTARRALDACAATAPRICDPACGGGVFLLEALDWLRERRVPAPERLLYGIDVDPLAVDCTRAALWLALADPGAPPDIFHHGVRCGDALVGVDPARAVDFPAASLGRRAGDGAHPGVHHGTGSWERELTRQRARLRGVCWPAAVAERWSEGQRADLWCAIWFWPPDRLALLPDVWLGEDVPGDLPADVLADVPADVLATARDVARSERFFHLPLAWPEVVRAGGFDAVVGNPPWELERPDSRQWFEQHDPRYRARTKQEAVARQRRLFRDQPALERAWLLHNARHRARAHWFRERLSSKGDRNLYVLFLGRALDLLREDGALGMLVPAGLASDRGTGPLRRRLLEQTRWDWLFAFENTEGLFDIHKSYSFCAVVARRGGRTTRVRTAFGRTRAEDWEEAEDIALEHPRELIARTSPRHGVLIPFRSRRDRALYERIQARGEPLFEGDWGVRYRREIDLTLDSRHFRTVDELPPGGRLDRRGAWLVADWRRGPAPAQALRSADGGHWCDADSVTACLLPLYQGSMIQQYSHRAKGWDGRSWRCAAAPRPRFWIPEALYRERRERVGPKLALRDVARATDARSLIVAPLPDLPCGNVLPVLESDASPALLAAVLNSFVVDWACRQRLAGAHLNRFFLEELPVLPRTAARADPALEALAWRLVPPHPDLPRARGSAQPDDAGRELRGELEARIALLFGLDHDDLRWILRDCDHLQVGRTLPGADPRGFWRVDRSLTPGRRSTNLTLSAHARLCGALERPDRP